ncbi:hypothetical protein DFH28DRAFT_1086081 [Melampsora americana]|nr:hypothetical protein DFH28DRAFT_1086081 [Melampsora americana]
MPSTRSQQSQTSIQLSTSVSQSGQVCKTVPPAPQTKKRPPRPQATKPTTITTTTSTTDSERRFSTREEEEELFGNSNCSQPPATKLNSISNDNWTLPTVSNYQSLAKEWSTLKIAEARRQYGRTASAVPPHIQKEGEPLPPASLAKRNQIIGNKWTTLSDMEHMVYDPAIFYTLSGLPLPKKLQPLDLSPADCDKLQIIYDKWVSIRKVSKVHASVAEGHPGVKVIGDCPEQGFPRKPDPAQYLREKGFPVEAVQLPGSTLRHDDLLLGFDKMNSKQINWLSDLNAGLFKFKKITKDSNASNNTNGPHDGMVSSSANTARAPHYIAVV